MCKLMVRTWGHLFNTNEKKNKKIHVNPAKFTSLLCGLCYNIIEKVATNKNSKEIFGFMKSNREN